MNIEFKVKYVYVNIKFFKYIEFIFNNRCKEVVYIYMFFLL